MNYQQEKEKYFGSGTYILDRENLSTHPKKLNLPISSLTEGTGFHTQLEKESVIEHVDWQVLHRENPAVMIVSGIHGDEFETAELFEQTQAEFLVPRVQLLRAHVAAVFMGSRGYDAPKLNEDDRDIDLNRQFPFTGNEQSWEDFFAKVTYPEAKLLLEVLKDNHQAEFLFTFHEDPLRTNNFYFYDSPYDERDDVFFELIRNLRIELHAQLLAYGFKMLNGPDDAADPHLANIAKNGYIYQPLINQKGVRKTDTSFESAAIELGGKNLLNMKRVFTFEIPGNLTRERKALLIQLIRKYFMIPFLAAQGIEEVK